MASREKTRPAVPDAEFTTNEEDQREATKIRERLSNKRHEQHTKVDNGTDKSDALLPSVFIDDGAHKYVLIRASTPKDYEEQYIVTSRRGASYHRNAAEPMITKLEEAGYTDIEVTGGGRIYLDEKNLKISIFGYSYGFGQADHSISQRTVLADPRYKGYDVTFSNEGY